jgi:hypothetical protein
MFLCQVITGAQDKPGAMVLEQEGALLLARGNGKARHSPLS